MEVSVDLIVTGSGRSGSGYMAKMLTASGLPCGHEQVFGPDGPRVVEGLRADSSWLALPWLEGFRDVPTVLVHRDPRLVIGSFLGIGFFDQDPHPAHYPYLRFLDLHFPEVLRLCDPFERACQWYITANEVALASANIVTSLDKIAWRSIDEMLPVKLEYASARPLVAQDTNTRARLQDVPPLPKSVRDCYANLQQRSE